MFMLSPAASAEIRAAASRSEADGLALRVAARVEADGSLRFGMGFDEPREGDLPLEIDGVALLIGKPSQELLDDAMLDFVEMEPGRHGFVCVPQPEEQTPPAKKGCGSGGCGSCGG